MFGQQCHELGADNYEQYFFIMNSWLVSFLKDPLIESFGFFSLVDACAPTLPLHPEGGGNNWNLGFHRLISATPLEWKNT